MVGILTHNLSRLDLDAGTCAELRALEGEGDPALRDEALLNLAQRQEQAGHLEVAAGLYQSLAADSEGLRATSQAHLDALLGRGAFGARAEFLLRNFAQQAADPSAIFAMGAAGAAFRLTRLAALSRLAANPQPGFLLRLLGVGRVASLAGFAVEAPTFAVAGRLGNAALGREQEWTTRALGRELASSYLVLGGLKLTGGLASGLTATRRGILPALVNQSALLGGILLGHRLEELAGLRSPRDGATTLTDSLALLLQFHVAGRLTQAAFGRNFSQAEHSLELRASWLESISPLPRGPFGAELPALAMASAAPVPSQRNEAAGPLSAEPLFSVRPPELDSQLPESAPREGETLPEVSVSRDGRTRPVDRDRASTVKLIEAQGVPWVIDIDTEDRSRAPEVWVGEHRLPRGGSLRVRDGDVIRLGERRYVFRDTAEAVSAVIPRPELRLRRILQPFYGGGESGRFTLRVGPFLESIAMGQDYEFATGPQGPARLRRLVQETTARGERYHLEVFDAERAFRTRVEVTPERLILESHPEPVTGSALLPMFTDWLGTHAAIRAADWEFRDLSPGFQDLLQSGLIHNPYNRWEGGEGRRHLVTQPRGTLLPAAFGPQHRAAAEAAFQAWARRRLGQGIPTLLEIEAGAPLPVINRLGVEPSMVGILDRLVGPRTRFLEIGFGDRTETLQAVERRGGTAWGLELSRVYPETADREELRRAPLDVLFVNGSPFLFYAQHHVALPAALDILRAFPRAEWLVLQAYNPRTPFEILRHAEELNRMQWEPVLFRAAASLAEPPLFPTDWCQRPDTPHAVLIARRSVDPK